MAQQRSTSRGPKGPSRPGRSGAARRAAEARAAAAAAAARLRRVDPRQNPKLTGRAIILVLVCAVLVLSFASSLQAYLQQRRSIDDLKSQIDTRQQQIQDLETEKARWKDPAYIEAQARQRFGYVMPGETSYVALDSDGNRIQPAGELADPSTVGEKKESPWWGTVWDSVELAGNPPADPDQPAEKITQKGTEAK
ncbi:FtsB family cell division protein [Nocardioides sp. Kera G14]|uniref:FtsB family cell division protein n=1 Tax=Nocardioides sp. Kera G14 TaxID=2884264 RepID=UPI001D103381|nr:septum formation initiator family protein [Nocardioides sp. Kera G14]UDY22988.1 septum formation initiator family protein [Nocardioides sp. Kera G14]